MDDREIISLGLRCTLQAGFPGMYDLVNLSTLDRTSSIAVETAFVTIFRQQYGRLLPSLKVEAEDAEASEGGGHLPNLPNLFGATLRDIKLAYARLYWYSARGTFYDVKEPNCVQWKHLMRTPQAFVSKPSLHLCDNLLFLTVIDQGISSVSLYDCATLRQLQTLGDARVASVLGSVIYMLHPGAISARKASDVTRVVASYALGNGHDWNDIANWASDHKYSAYLERRQEGDEMRLRISVHDSATLEHIRFFDGPAGRRSDGSGYWRCRLDVDGDDVMLYIQCTSEAFLDRTAAATGSVTCAGGGQWRFQYNMRRTGAGECELLSKWYDACGLFEVTDHCLVTGRGGTNELREWKRRGKRCGLFSRRRGDGDDCSNDSLVAEIGYHNDCDSQSPWVCLNKVSGDRYVCLTVHRRLETRRTLRVICPWKFSHDTKDLIDAYDGETFPTDIAVNEWFVAVLMELPKPHADLESGVDTESDSGSFDSMGSLGSMGSAESDPRPASTHRTHVPPLVVRTEYTLKIANIAEHAFAYHDVDSDSESNLSGEESLPDDDELPRDQTDEPRPT